MARCPQLLLPVFGSTEGLHWGRSLRRTLGALFFGALVLVGCATGPDWNPRIGHYLYDDAVKEYGPPTGKETLTDGTLVADWLITSGRVVGSPGPGMYNRRFWSGSMNVYTTPEAHLVLLFGPDKRLTGARQIYK